VARHLSWHIGQLGIDPSAGPDLTEVVKAFAERAETLKDMAAEQRFSVPRVRGLRSKSRQQESDCCRRSAAAAAASALAAVSEWQVGTPIHAAVNQGC
jgi:glutamyl-tRNA synthetase